jgi:hypothetical protein
VLGVGFVALLLSSAVVVWRRYGRLLQDGGVRNALAWANFSRAWRLRR